MTRIDTRYVPNEWEIYAHKIEAKVLKLDAQMKRLEANQIKGRCGNCTQGHECCTGGWYCEYFDRDVEADDYCRWCEARTGG